jgi:hypothetical protein
VSALFWSLQASIPAAIVPLFDRVVLIHSYTEPVKTYPKKLAGLYRGALGVANMGLDLSLPRTLHETILWLIVLSSQACLSAFILGTMFHYLMRKDPAEEALNILLNEVTRERARVHAHTHTQHTQHTHTHTRTQHTHSTHTAHTHTHTHIHTHTYTHTHTHLLNLCCQQVNTFARHWALPPRLRAKLTDFIKFQHKKGWSTSTFALPRSMEIQVSETIEHTYTLWLTTILVPLAFYINPYFLLLFFTYASSNCSIDRNEKRC